MWLTIHSNYHLEVLIPALELLRPRLNTQVDDGLLPIGDGERYRIRVEAQEEIKQRIPCKLGKG